MKPMDGVDYVEYDAYGYQVKKEGQDEKLQKKFVSEEDKKYDFRDYLAKEDDNAGFEFIAAGDEQLEKAKAMMAA